MNPFVSVILPVYNSKDFIGRALDSLINQSLGEWEAICIDDGSLDGSSELLDNYALKDKRIKVKHTQNQGVSMARNEGMEFAQGDFVTYLDSDDFLHPQTFEICKKIISADNPDMVSYTYDRSYRRNVILKKIFRIAETNRHNFKEYNAEKINYKLTDDIFRYATEYSHPKLPRSEKKWAVKHCQPWRCLYRKQTIEDIKFIKGIIYEDFPWWGEVLLKVKKTAILNLPLYFYYPNLSGFIGSASQKYRIESLEIAIEKSRETYLQEANEYQREMWNKNFITPFTAKLYSKLKRYHKTIADS